MKSGINDRMIPSQSHVSSPHSPTLCSHLSSLYFPCIIDPACRFSSIFQQEKGGYQATTEDGGLYDIVYYFGIIDIFTTYNIKKALEHTYKSTIYETKVLSISFHPIIITI
jgi:Phosphatidylinositol-4-phosphate 5-Kinase